MKILNLNKLASVVLLMLIGGFAQASSWQPRVDNAVWTSSTSIFECRLVHPIPRYGQAVFDARAGETPRFYLDPEKNLMEPGQASIEIKAPAWKRGEQHKDLGTVTVTRAKYRGFPVILDEKTSDLLLSELSAGYSAVFTRPSNYSTDDDIKVGLLPVNFRKAYADYQRCLVTLLPTNFDQISRSKIHFDTGKHNLDEMSRELLDLIAIYMKGDREVNEVYIDGYTDNVGRDGKNIKLSKKRAETVLNYLVKAGVPDELVITRYHGQQYPLAKNNSDANRAKNRRVTIRLDRVPEEVYEDDELQSESILGDS